MQVNGLYNLFGYIMKQEKNSDVLVEHYNFLTRLGIYIMQRWLKIVSSYMFVVTYHSKGLF